jgi:hypothetical protein
MKVKRRYIGPLKTSALNGEGLTPLSGCIGWAWKEVMDVDGILQTLFQPLDSPPTPDFRYIVNEFHLVPVK